MIKIKRPIYEVLEEVMQDKDLKIAEVARLCGLPDSTVRTIITRKSKSVALDVAFKLSSGLSVPLDYLNGKTQEVSLDPDKEILDKLNQLSPEDRKAVEKIIDSLQK